MKRNTIIALAFCSSVGVSVAAKAIPEGGLRAEMQNQWPEAIGIYLQALKTDPAQASLWERIADIRATRLSDPAGAAQALVEAVKYAPTDARLHAKLSQAFAASQNASAGLTAINRAIELTPDNVDYLRARGNIAIWINDYALAERSFDAALAIAPNDLDSILGSARALAHGGKNDAAAQRYRAYLMRRPQDRTVMLEYMEFEAGRNNKAAIKEYDEIYRHRFEVDTQYLLRMAEIYELGGDSLSAAETLREVAKGETGDAKLYYRLSQSYPNDHFQEAAAAMERAVELDPVNIEYLRTRADMASMRGDYVTTLDSYQRILVISPDDAGAELGIARVRHWQGKLDASKKAYEGYFSRHPSVAITLLEYVMVLAELGDYAQAMERLEDYRKQFGDSIEYRKQKARVLAWAERPTPALDIVSEMDPVLTNDYELGYTRTVSLHYANRPRDALASLADVTRLRPNDKEAADLGRFIKTPLRSNVTAAYDYTSSTDDIDIQNIGLSGEYVFTPETRLLVGTDRKRVSTKEGSAYITPAGGTEIDYTRTWLGLKHRFSPKLSMDGQIGSGHAYGNSHSIYQVGVDYKPLDELGMRLSHQRDLFAVSPRSLGLGVEQRATTLNVSWMPNLRYTVDGYFDYSNFSDGNHRWEIVLAPRRAFARTQLVNLDLGISGRWFSFNKDTDHGYYAPSSYERYAFTAYTYWKINDDDGVSVVFSVGPYKDNTMIGYRTGGDIVAEGFFGLYRDWFLNVKAALSHYGGAATPGYGAHSFSISLTRRF
ncbi:tetratricopeptide repeat protein [Extensimonas sp. H3M7-6]|uniref:tetratricopeptide repeat protein n=1 Tax=Extensimonas soli TaxID=3031322 RepID=UPI0023DA0D5D|nr:tetratricopeptide repeat protein [Extensimonas sp. H3M7-6]MDF1480753.1 tetratricopeptide repeat protein [Extensimonas sp. H3M7-6]